MDSPELATRTSAALSASSQLLRGSGAAVAQKDAAGARLNAQTVRQGVQELKATRGPWTQ